MHLRYLLCLLAVVVAYGSQKVQDTPSTRQVDLGYAKYQGSRLAIGIDQYLGMRFAAPPLGDRRFRAPQDPPLFDGIQEASNVSKSGMFCPRMELS